MELARFEWTSWDYKKDMATLETYYFPLGVWLRWLKLESAADQKFEAKIGGDWVVFADGNLTWDEKCHVSDGSNLRVRNTSGADTRMMWAYGLVKKS